MILCHFDLHLLFSFTQGIKNVSRYNAGIQCLPITSDDFFEKWEPAKNLLTEMAAEGVKPDGVTLIKLLVSYFDDFNDNLV